MKKIITITLNPAFDLHYGLDRFEAEKENYVNTVICDAGGKGINISRALKFNGVENTAYVILGKENAAQFEQNMQTDGVNYIPVYTEGRIRENITLHPSGAKETRISLDNFSINSDILNELYAKLEKDLDEDTLVSFSGRIPKGVSKDEVIVFLKNIIAKGAKVAVDSNSLTPDDLIRIHPWFIKPNEQEIAAFLGREINDSREAASVAAELVARGLSEEVMISLGKHGSVWSDGKQSAIVSVPAITVLSTIGAGDSTVAGYIAATAKGDEPIEALRLACSFGTAACITEGTRPPMPDDVNKIFKDTSVIKV